MMIRTLTPLTDGGSVSEERLAQAGRWRKVEEMRAAVLAFQLTLAPIGGGLSKRKNGWWMVPWNASVEAGGPEFLPRDR